MPKAILRKVPVASGLALQGNETGRKRAVKQSCVEPAIRPFKPGVCIAGYIGRTALSHLHHLLSCRAESVSYDTLSCDRKNIRTALQRHFPDKDLGAEAAERIGASLTSCLVTVERE